MATKVVMPQMGESIAEGTITKWLVEVGETVERDQPLFEISTDKVDAEIPSPTAGTILEIKAEEGDTVPVDEVVALIGEEGEEPSASDEAAAETAAPEIEEEAPPDVDEEAEEVEEEVEDEEREEPQEEAEPTAEEPAEGEATEEEGEEDRELRERVRTYSSPLVRKMADKHGVDLEQVEGTGIQGRVTKEDMERYLEQREEAAAAEERPAAPEERVRPRERPARAVAPGAEEEFHVPAYTEGEDVEIEPMSRIREITAAHMAYSKRTSAHVTTVFHFDMTRVHQVREKTKRTFQEAHGTKLTYMPFIFTAVCAALRKHKKINASIDGTDIVYKKDINLGMAVAIDRGLIVPVIRNADQLSLAGLAKTANDLAERARSKRLSPDELQGGTFTITNPGVFGSLFGTPIINQPQVGIMGVGAIEKRPVVRTDEDGMDAIAIRVMSYFNISYDHRLVDGADADHFMNDVKEILENGDWPELEPFL